MFKILILTHGFNPDVGGIETNAEILASAFRDNGADVHVLTWTKQESKDKFPFTVIRSPGIKTIFKEHRWADVILENNPCLRLSWPNIFIHKPLVIALNTWVNRLTGNKGLRDKLKALWFRRAETVIAVSDAVRRKEWQRAMVIENPYNNHLFKINPGIKKTRRFVFLGRLVSDKGADQAIQALSALANENILDKNSVQLTIIGDGPEKENLVLLIKKLGLENAIVLTGILKEKELVDCLNLHQFILIPSYWEEPYGNVVLEGMACGCIPIASDGGGLPEAVGEAGLLFKRNNPDDMVNVLKNILRDEDKAAIILIKAQPHLAQRSQELVAAKYFQILKQAVAAT
jgi:glycosyltransferase involved in cell wall biosynthesis